MFNPQQQGTSCGILGENDIAEMSVQVHMHLQVAFFLKQA